MQQNPEFLGNWILAAGIIITISVNILAILRTNSVQKREVRFAEHFATTQQLDDLESQLGSRIDKIDGDLKGLRDSIILNGERRKEAIEAKVERVRLEAVAGVGQLADRIGSLAVQIGKVEGHLQDSHASTNQQIVLLGAKLDRVIERESDRNRTATS